MRRLTLLLALLGALVALSVAGAGQASTVASTLPAFSGATFQLTDPYPRPAVTVGTFTYSVPAGEVIVGATISGYFGNSAVPNSAGVDVRLNGALVGQCVMYDTCYWLGAPWSHTFSASEARSLLGSGSAVLTAVQTSQYTIRLGPDNADDPDRRSADRSRLGDAPAAVDDGGVVVHGGCGVVVRPRRGATRPRAAWRSSRCA